MSGLYSRFCRVWRLAVWSFLLVSGGLLPGCRSARPGYRFQPGGAQSTAYAVARPDTVPAVSQAAPVTAPPAPLPQKTSRPRRVRPSAGLALAIGALAVPVSKSYLLARPATQAQRRPLRQPQKPAEVGLGTTVFGILGLLALPIGLLGLVLGGGLGWLIVAAAGAVAILVAWLDPFN